MTDMLQDPDYRGPDQENDFPLLALAGPTNDVGNYFDWVNADDAIIDTAHHILPNTHLYRIGIDISRDTEHVQGDCEVQTGTGSQDLGQQHIQEAEARKFLISAADPLETLSAGVPNHCPNSIAINTSTIDLPHITSNISGDSLETNRKQVSHSNTSNTTALTISS